MTDNILLIGYFTNWLITLCLYVRKREDKIDATSTVFFFQLVYSLFSILLYNDNAYGHLFKPLKLFPFIYLYLMVMFTTLPVMRYTTVGLTKIQKPTTLYVHLLALLFIIPTFIELPNIISNFIQGTKNIILSSTAGMDMYNESISNSKNIGDGSISNVPAILRSAFSSLGFLLLFYCLALPKKNKFIVVSLTICCVTNIIGWISLGQRGGVIKMLLVLIISYMAFKKFLSKKINRIARCFSVFLIILLSVPLIALTVSRFSTNDGGPLSSLYYYAGQANLYFNNYGLDDNGIRYGDRTFPIVKKILGFENVPSNFVERRVKYPYLHINDEVFSTYIGDFTIDFGPIGGAFVLIIITCFTFYVTKIRNGTMAFHQIVILHLAMSVCIQGGMSLYQFADIGGAIQIALYIIVYIVFRIDYETNYKHNANLISFIYSNNSSKK